MFINLINHAQAAQHTQGMRRRHARRVKPVRASRATELWYKASLLEIVTQCTTTCERGLLPLLQGLAPMFAKTADGLTLDRESIGASSTIAAHIKAMREQFGGIDGVAKRLAEAATSRSLASVDAQLGKTLKVALGIDVSGFLTLSGPIQTVTQAATRMNVALIKSIPEQYFERIEQIVMQGVADGLRYEALADSIRDVGGVTQSRAELIARDQVSKLSGAMNQIRQMSLGLERYTWSTSDDERVRDEHAALDGQEFAWADTPPDGHPGEAVNCRCVAIPVINVDPDPRDEGAGPADVSEGGTVLSQAAATVAQAALIGEFFGSLAKL